MIEAARVASSFEASPIEDGEVTRPERERRHEHREVRLGQRRREDRRVDRGHGRPLTPKWLSRALNASLVPTLARVLTKLYSSSSNRRLVAKAWTR